MRWIWWGIMLCGVMLLAGCGGNDRPTSPPTSLLTFRYDAARDVVIAVTHPLSTETAVNTARYAEALARQPEVSYAPAATLRLARPEVTVEDDVLSVNYREATGLTGLASVQTEAILAALEAWRWVPGIKSVHVQALGQPLTLLGQLELVQPLVFANHTYVVQPVTGEMGYLTGGLNPESVTQAVTLLQRREIRDQPALQGFRPILPVGTTLTVATDRIENGILPADLSVNFPRAESPRLAALLLNLAQFSTVEAVRFTFGGLTIDTPFMRGNLNAPITPYDLLLPAETAVVAGGETATAVRTVAQEAVGRAATFGPVRTWREWALVTTQPTEGQAAQTVLLRRRAEAYTVAASGATLSVPQLLRQGVPVRAVLAFRLPGWEQLALTED